MAKVKMDFRERIKLASWLPATGNVLSLKITKTLKEKLFISAKEAKKFNLKSNADEAGNTTVIWDSKKDTSVVIEFTETEEVVIKGALNKANDEKRLTEEDLSLCDKFGVA